MTRPTTPPETSAESFTWEHPAHLYFRGAVSGRGRLGNPAQHLDRVAAQQPDGVGDD